MGLRELFGKIPKLWGKVVFRWQEPLAYRIRLRGDLWLRCLIALAGWGFGTGLMAVLFAFNVKPPGTGFALGMGAVVGLGPAVLIMFMSREQVGGSVTIDQNAIRYHCTYASPLFFAGQWSEYADYDYRGISRCVIIPARHLGQSFSVMLLTIDSTVEIMGIPQKISLKELARHLSSKGIDVSQGDTLPERFCRPIGIPMAGSLALVGIFLFFGGLGFYPAHVGAQNGGGGNAVERDFAMPDFPDFPQPPQLEPPQFEPPGFDSQQLPDQQVVILPGANANLADNSTNGDIPLPPASSPFSPPFPTGPPTATPTQPGIAGPAPTDRPLPRQPQPPTVVRPSVESPSESEGELIGGTGGSAFRNVNRQGQPLIGVRFSMGSWAGKAALRQFDPIFERGPSRGFGEPAIAREGYAVGGLNVEASPYVAAVQLVYMRLQPDGRLDPSDTYTSDWLGTRSDAPARSLGGNGAPAIGVQGRRAAILDAVGLVFADD